MWSRSTISLNTFECSATIGWISRPARRRALAFAFGKSEVERRSARSLILGPQASAVREHDGAAQRQAQSQPQRLGGVIRLEDHLFTAGGNAAAGVGHGNPHLTALDAARPQRERAGVPRPPPHGPAGVDNQIDPDLLQL